MTGQSSVSQLLPRQGRSFVDILLLSKDVHPHDRLRARGAERIQHIGCKSSTDGEVTGLLAISDGRPASNCRCVIQMTIFRMVHLVDESSAVGEGR